MKTSEIPALRRLRHGLTRRYLIALSLVGLMSLTAFVSLRAVILLQNANAPTINVSGRQRMLSQRIALYSQRLVAARTFQERNEVRATLRSAADLMLNSHRGLVEGDKELGLPGIGSPVVRAMYFEDPVGLDGQVRQYLNRVDALLEAEDARLTSGNPDLVAIQMAASDRLLRSLDRMVKQYEAESQADLEFLEWMENGIFGLTLMILLLEALLIFRPMVSQIVKDRGALLENEARLQEAKTRTDNILGSVEEGLFLLEPTAGGSLVIGSQYSKSLVGILGFDFPAGTDFVGFMSERLPPEATEELRTYLQLFLKGRVSDGSLARLNPLREVLFRDPRGADKYLDFEFKRVSQAGAADRIFVLVRDITREKELAERLAEVERKGQRDMERLFTILHVEPRLLKQFNDGFAAEMERIGVILQKQERDLEADSLRDRVRGIFTGIHTLKGNASILKLEFLEKDLHALEDDLQELLRREGIAPLDLLGVTTGVRDLVGKQKEVAELLERILAFNEGYVATETRVADMLELTLTRLVRRTADDLGKQVRLDVSGFDFAVVPEAHANPLRDALVHLARNSISHGIETAEERTASGKPPEGTVTLRSSIVDDSIRIELQDDGRGLQLDRLRAAAVERGELDADAARDLSPTDAARLIFAPGVSTSENADLISGRGVGMDAVKTGLNEIGASIAVETRPGGYCLFRITLPLTTDRSATA